MQHAILIAPPRTAYRSRLRLKIQVRPVQADFADGFQTEKADDWQKYGDPWSKRRDDKTITVEFADQKVLAVPYDMPILATIPSIAAR